MPSLPSSSWNACCRRELHPNPRQFLNLEQKVSLTRLVAKQWKMFFLEISFNLKGLAGLTCKLEWCHKLSTPGQRDRDMWKRKCVSAFKHLVLESWQIWRVDESPWHWPETHLAPIFVNKRPTLTSTLASPSSLPPSSWTSWSPSEDHEPVQDKRNCTCSQAAIWSNLGCHYHGFTSLTFVRTFLL